MMWMNEYEIDNAVAIHRDHPVLAKATRFLAAFRDEVNAHSDGWPYWRPPAKAATKLMVLIHNPYSATPEAYRAALGPIRNFYTRRGNAAGMRFPTEESV